MSFKTKTIIRRAIKGFLAGGISSLATFMVASSYQLPTGETATQTLIIAFFCGGLLGWDKYLSWTDEPLPPVENNQDGNEI